VSTLQLIREVIVDVRTLLRQEIALVRAETREELSHVLGAFAALAVAVGTLAVGGLWILIAITRGLAEVFGWPMTGVYAGIGIALAIIGLVLLAIARRQMKAVRILPQSRRSLKEHLPPWPARHVEEGG